MSTALKLPSRHMTVAEFLVWDSGDRSGALWQLRDGEPERMVPASVQFGAIHARLAHLLVAHSDGRGGQWQVVIAPGVIPRVRARENYRIPDIGVFPAPQPADATTTDPVMLIEVLSPSNERETRANVWAYTTIPSVSEMLLLRSTDIGAELLRRQPDGFWPANPEKLGPDDELRFDSIGFAAPLRSAYRNTGIE